MDLGSDAGNSSKVYEDIDPDDVIIVPRSRRRPRRIIQDDSSSSSDDDEDDIPLNKRKAAKKQTSGPTIQPPPPQKRLKLDTQEQYESPRNMLNLFKQTKIQPPSRFNLHKKPALTPLPSTQSAIKQPVIIIKKMSRRSSARQEMDTQSPPPSKPEIKAPSPVNPPPTTAPSSSEFRAPFSVRSTNEFKAPAPMGPPSSASSGFKVPMAVNSTNDCAAPQGQPTDLITSRLMHYISSICQDLNQYNMNKIKAKNSLLTFRETDDLPTLDISVMKKFTSLTSSIIKHHKNLDALDMDKFGKVIKLMENTVIVSTDVDIIEHYAKNMAENKESTFDMLNMINDALETCSMIFDILTTCKLDKKFLSQNLITNCLHFIKNQLDYTIYPIIDANGFEDEAISLTSNADSFVKLIMQSPRQKHLISTFIPLIIRFFRRAFTLILAEDLDDDVLVIVAYISMAPFFHDFTESSTSILMQDLNQETTFSPYEQLKFCALDILKHIFSRYPKHRRWIFEEILTSLGSLTVMDGARKYRLRDNRSIHVISALFMQLVQCCSSLSDYASHKGWYSKWYIKYQKMVKKKNVDQIKLLDDKLVQHAADAWRLGAEAAANSASFFLEFLMSKCKSRKMDAYSLAEYRSILSQTLQDIMTVFNDPEWPVAELIIRVFSRILMTVLTEDRSDQFLKSLAIEWLGIISSKIKTGYNRLSGDYKTYTPEWICELNETLAIKVDKDTPIQSLALLDQCRKKLLDYVVGERVNPNVIQFYLCNWGFIESVVWIKANKGWEIQQKKRARNADATPNITDNTTTTPTAEDTEKKNEDDLDDLDEDTAMAETTAATNTNSTDTSTETADTNTMDVNMDEDSKWPKENALLLEDTCKFYWLSCLGIDYPFPNHGGTEAKQYEFPEMSRSDYMLLTELLASRQTLYTSYNFILSEVLLCLDKDAVVYRTKALKAIGKIASEVPEIMEDTRIRASVVQRIHDSSPSVRDAAVDVVAKYLGRLDHVPMNLYEVVSARIMDTAVTVRKRLVKLLREFYFKLTDHGIKIDVASKLMLRIGDNEITISQLSLKATQEILFLPFKEIEKDGNDYMGYSYANSPKERRRKITDLTLVITGAVSKLDPSVSAQNIALSQIIQKTIDGADEKSLVWYEKVFQWIVDSLFDRMIKLEEEDDSVEFINCLATVYSFTKSCPSLLRESHISLLQPYMNATEDAEWLKARYVLSIYRDVLPQMKYHDPEFVSSVERILMKLLSQCPLDLITDGISCLCVIVDTISFRYNILIKMLGSCVSKLRKIQHMISNGQVSEDSSFAGVLKMILMCGLLCQNFEFDKKREQQPKEMEALNLVYKGDICMLVFDVLQFFTGELMDDLSDQGMSMRMTALQGLGYFFASHPTYMISAASTTLMDKIFEQGTIELKTQLMRVYQEFLSAEEKRIDRREGSSTGSAMYTKNIDINTLLGDTEEYAELGVNGSLMQRYLRKILKCALAESEDLRYAAFEVVSAIIHQGLAHPVLCMPAIVAAETSPDLILRNKAFYLHKYAHDKYGNLLYSQMNEYLSTSYQYQKILYGSQVQGKQNTDVHPDKVCSDSGHPGYGKRGGDAKMDAVLGVTFSVMKDKKKARFDFFSALVKPFSFDLKTTTADEIDIDYLKYLAENAISLELSTTEEVLHMVYIMDRILMTLGTDLLSYVHFLKKQGIVATIDEASTDEQDMDSDFTLAAKLALALCILMYMKNLLVELYDIPDDEIREFNPNSKRRPRDVTRDMDVKDTIDWTELLYFKNGKRLNKQTASDACIRFEYLIMSDTTAAVIEDVVDEDEVVGEDDFVVEG
ncbi:hypothetical protein MAM1_0047d03232 [Mucor ambiguus]|uniref:Sister chromatid cohesion protein n=1 Tax=Mucor ambiguus TaxID=91626 RepID=A0A0C9ML04_9FUNG|nr:hypothetical protein MAM1_0047d03232 [Mucor ambiguus]